MGFPALPRLSALCRLPCRLTLASPARGVGCAAGRARKLRCRLRSLPNHLSALNGATVSLIGTPTLKRFSDLTGRPSFKRFYRSFCLPTLKLFADLFCLSERRCFSPPFYSAQGRVCRPLVLTRGSLVRLARNRALRLAAHLAPIALCTAPPERIFNRALRRSLNPRRADFSASISA